MNTNSPDLKTAMLDRIRGDAPRKVWTPSDFVDLASRDAIDKALQRLTKAESLRRIDRGLYDQPGFNKLTQKPNPPDPRSVIDAVGRRDQTRMLVDGMTAANDLGLTDAVPAKVVVHTDARRRAIKLGNVTITFRPTAASKLFWAGRPAMRVVQALHWLRDLLAREGESDQVKRKLGKLFEDPTAGPLLKADLTAGMTALPTWMWVFLKPLVEGDTRCSPSARSMMLIMPVQIMIVIDKGGTVTMISIMPPSPVPSGNCSPPRNTNRQARCSPGDEDMNPAFDEVLAAGSDAMLSAFDTTALRLGTASQNIEKDFWVCWALDALFNGLKEGGPRLLFKGGTSLSKGFGLINRFSEDIDVTVFRDDIGEPATIEELDALSGKKRRARLEAIKDACQTYINGPLRAELMVILQKQLRAAGLDAGAARVEADDTDPDGQTLLIWYPAATPRSDYVRAAIKIESGAKSALDPNSEVPIKPYVDDDLPALDLTVPAVRTVDPERTFWDKVVILHGLRRWFDKRGELRGGGQRVSRHYYDLHLLAGGPVGEAAIAETALGVDCVAHARMFFNRPDFDLASAAPGSFALSPHNEMIEQLRIDYRAMQGMIFGDPPGFEAVLESISSLETRLNGNGASESGAAR